jgi:transposase InsO family protein
VPAAANVCWSLDFTSNVLTDGRRFRKLNVPDDYNRQLLGVEIDFSLPASRVVQVLRRLVKYHGLPAQLRTDNGPRMEKRTASHGSLYHNELSITSLESYAGMILLPEPIVSQCIY